MGPSVLYNLWDPAGSLLRVKPVLVSAGDKYAATEFAKSGTKSSNLQTNKCAVGSEVNLLMTGCLLSPPVFGILT